MPTISCFLALPGEVRNQIYSSLLVIPSTPYRQEMKPSSSIALTYPSILRACRQTHDEAAVILYRHNVFLANEWLLTSMPRLRSWYEPVTSHRYIPMIRRYRVLMRLECDARFDRTIAEMAFSNLEEVTIDVFQAAFGSTDHEKLRLLEGVRGVRKVRVEGSTAGFKAYAAWLETVMASPAGTCVAEFAMAEGIGRKLDSLDPWLLST